MAVKKGHVRITDKNTGKSTEKVRRPTADARSLVGKMSGKARDKVIDKATGRTADVHKPVR